MEICTRPKGITHFKVVYIFLYISTCTSLNGPLTNGESVTDNEERGKSVMLSDVQKESSWALNAWWKSHDESDAIFHNGDEAGIEVWTKNEAKITEFAAVVEFVAVIVLLMCRVSLRYNK